MWRLTRCTTAQRTGTSPVQLVIVSLEGGPGNDEAAYRHTFESDVLTSGRVVEDGGRVLLALALKDPGTADLPTRPSPPNFVTVTGIASAISGPTAERLPAWTCRTASMAA